MRQREIEAVERRRLAAPSDSGDPRLALLVFVTLSFALVGGIAAAFLHHRRLSLGSLVGMVSVIGMPPATAS